MVASDTEEEINEGEFVQEIAYLVPDIETTCSICHAEFLDYEDLNIHVNQVHEGFTPSHNICQFCDKTYGDLDGYACHIRDDHFCELRCCRFCTKCFTDLRTYKKHERKHHHKKSGMYACSQCTGLFTTKKEVQFHELLYHDNQSDGIFLRCMPHLSAVLKLRAVNLLQSTEKNFHCQSCDFTSIDDFQSYFDHLNNDKCTVYVCDLCSTAFKGKKSLLKHIRLAKGCLHPKEYLSKLTKCPTCKNDVDTQYMKTHLKSCHIYKCETCNLIFETIDDLSSHQSEVHPLDLAVLKCEYCFKEYVGRKALDKHIERSHRHMFILYKYACKECDAIFKHPKKLFGHYFTQHKDLQPYTCRICDKKFRIRKSFTIHIKLEHLSAGVVEFDENYHVFFAEKKSEKPFIPTCVVPELLPVEDSNNVKNVVNSLRNSTKTRGKKVKGQDSDENFSDIVMIDDNSTTDMDFDESDAKKTKNKPVKPKSKTKNLKRMKKKTGEKAMSSSDDDDAEPLVKTIKKAGKKRLQSVPPGFKKDVRRSGNQKQFTCKVCNKYCYTYQNYHNHVKTHSKNELIECIKCSRSFKTKNELSEHVSTDHATSRLIETLKSVLERKQVDSHTSSDHSQLTNSERFARTLVRVKIEKANVPATIKASNNSSVKNFFENFVPEVNEPKEIKFEPVVTIKHYDSPFYRKRYIQLLKFTPEKPDEKVQLKMPEKFKAGPRERIKLNVRLVQKPLKQLIIESNEITSYENESNDNFQEYDDYEDFNKDNVPEVAEEVMLEGSEEPPKEKKVAAQKIPLPKLPEGYKDIHIATLHSQAPFYKIIKVRRTNDQSTIISGIDNPEPALEEDNIVSLPDGTKFVAANPLAHLLGDKAVEEVIEPIKNKNYTPVRTNYKGLLASALQNLEKRKDTSATRRPRKRKNQSTELA